MSSIFATLGLLFFFFVIISNITEFISKKRIFCKPNELEAEVLAYFKDRMYLLDNHSSEQLVYIYNKENNDRLDLIIVNNFNLELNDFIRKHKITLDKYEEEISDYQESEPAPFLTAYFDFDVKYKLKYDWRYYFDFVKYRTNLWRYTHSSKNSVILDEEIESSFLLKHSMWKAYIAEKGETNYINMFRNNPKISLGIYSNNEIENENLKHEYAEQIVNKTNFSLFLGGIYDELMSLANNYHEIKYSKPYMYN